MRPWTAVGHVDTASGVLELRRRGDDDFLLSIGGRVLMNSAARRSEEMLAAAGGEALRDRPRGRVLVGGLGMGLTLRALLARLGPGVRVDVVDLEPAVIDWCRGPLASINGNALADRRVHVACDDVARVIAESRGAFDAILLDLFEGPHQETPASRARGDSFYGRTALERAKAALRPHGLLAIWSEDPDAAFERRLRARGFETEVLRPPRGGRRHVVYAGKRPPAAAARSAAKGGAKSAKLFSDPAQAGAKSASKRPPAAAARSAAKGGAKSVKSRSDPAPAGAKSANSKSTRKPRKGKR